MDQTKLYIRISELISDEFTGELTVEQKAELDNWIQLNPENKLLYEKLKSKEALLETIEQTEKINKDIAWEKINADIDKKKRTFKLTTSGFLKYAAIIMIPLLIGVVVQRTLLNNKIDIITEDILEDDIPVDAQIAILTLSDGTEVTLEKNNTNTITAKNNVSISNANSTLAYLEDDQQEIVSLIFNKLKTPKGGEYRLVLADGSKVWLNADTELKYPVSFSDTIRQVYLAGEAYFEVEHNSEKPFIVTTDKLDVTVLGTSFNVMAYSDENQTETTLVEGKVSITENSEAKSKAILSPGHQASLDINTQILSSRKVDTDTYTAWKNGKFVFMNEDLSSIMRKLYRWYDIIPIFENEDLKEYHFTGTLKRYDSINDILEKIELTTNVSFDIGEGSVIISKKE